MTTFVTGGTSSIGRVLVKELARQGECVRLLVRASSNRSGLELPGVEFADGDVTDPASILKGLPGCDLVVHMAAIVGHDVPEATWWKVNRDGTDHVLRAALDLGVTRVVQVSSIAVLGPTPPGETHNESNLPDPSEYFNLYQKTKRAADDLARAYAQKGLPVRIVIPGFGFGCSHASSHPSLQEMTLLRMAAGKPVAILGSGKNRICLSYYNDTAAGILLAAEKGQPGESYILTCANLTFPEIWDPIAAALGKRPPTRRLPLGLLKTVSRLNRTFRKHEIFPSDFFDMIGCDWVYSSNKAQQNLGWRPTPYAESIQQTWLDYQSEGWKP